MNILDLVLNWIIFWRNSMKKRMFKTYWPGLCHPYLCFVIKITFALLEPSSEWLTLLSSKLFWAPPNFEWHTLLSTYLSNQLFWAVFFSVLLFWAIFWALVWAVELVWALLWALSRVHLLSRALFWVDLLSRVLFWALFGGLSVHQNLPQETDRKVIWQSDQKPSITSF